MAARFASDKNLKFMLYEVHDAVSLTAYEYFAQHNRKTFDMILDAAMRLAKDLLRPSLEEMDRTHPALENQTVTVHPDVRRILRESGEGGWIASRLPAEWDGGQLPAMVAGAAEFLFAAANYSGSVYSHLTTGAANLILSFGSDALKAAYVPRMLAGEWQGTMALTEPQAGSSLADLITTAVLNPDGTYTLRGRKVFISAGDHTGADNVIHLLLARIEGAPAGVKGISLFVVPKKHPLADGTLAPNDVTVSQVFHKMGYRGCPITELAIGDREGAVGWLVGEPHKGLSYMFQMMNEARLGVGMGATAIASAAYYAALEYAKERPQGRKLGQKDPSQPQVPIIEHADVKRMLLFQRAVVEGSLSLILQCFRYADLKHAAEGEAQEKSALLLELLTPVAKSYPSEMGILATSQGIQCLGGYGYCQDFPVEQYFRDIRIHPIHEGTTGIQGMDLLGRKVVMQNGRAMELFLAEVRQAAARAADVPPLAPMAEKLTAALDDLVQVTGHKVSIAARLGAEAFLADATLYLECFGIVAIGWQWLLQALAAAEALARGRTGAKAHFYQGKILTCRYFFAYEMPKISGLKTRLLDPDPITLDAEKAHFND